MTKKMIKKEVSFMDAYEFGGKVTDLITALTNLTSVYGDDVELETCTDYNGVVTFSVMVEREETEQEYQSRLDREFQAAGYAKEAAKRQLALYKERFPDLFK